MRRGLRKWVGFFVGLATLVGLALAGLQVGDAYWAVVGLYAAFCAGNAGEHLAQAIGSARRGS